MRYAPDGNVKVSYKKEGQTLVFYVKDEGSGIEKKIKNQYSEGSKSGE